jgi:predicted permease
MLWTQDVRRDIREEGTSYPTFRDWRAQSSLFQDMAICSRGRSVFLTGDSEPYQVMGESVSANLFPLLGVAPQLGRGFTRDDELAQSSEHNPGSADAVVVLIGHDLWQQRFGGSSNVLNQIIEVDGERAQIIGVMPAGFYFPTRETALWWPALGSEARFTDWYRVIGRLKPGVTFGQAQSEMSAIGQQLASTHPTTPPGFVGFDVNVVPMLKQFTGRTLPLALWILLGAVGFVLLIACANAANLLMARGVVRGREFGVRVALGAGRLRILRQLLTEHLALACVAALLGLALTFIFLQLLLRLAPPGIPRLNEVTVDAVVLGYTAGLTLVTALLFGLAPAWRLSRYEPQELLREGGRGAIGSWGLRRMREALVITECALAVALLAASGLLLRSFVRMQAVDPGYQPRGVLLARIALAGQEPTGRIEQVFQQVVTRVRALPGVQSAGMASNVFIRHNTDLRLWVRDAQGVRTDNSTPATSEPVTAEFLQAMGAQLKRGRFFAAADDKSAVAIVNETLADRLFPGQDPVGQQLADADPDGRLDQARWLTIVGVVRDLHRQGLERDVVAEYFQPAPYWLPIGDLVVRVTGDPMAVLSAVREQVRSTDPQATVLSASTVERRLHDLSAQRRLQTWLLGLFASAALLLSAIGIYGVMHYSVAERTQEIGVRVALGARARDVLRVIVQYGLRLALLGIGIGLAVALAFSRVLRHLLFATSPADPATLISVAGGLTAVAALACYLPARKAARLEPVQALRAD